MQKAVLRRKYHTRKKIFGTPDRPRLTVFRSNRHIYAQIIDDTAGATLASASTRVKAMNDPLNKSGNKHHFLYRFFQFLQQVEWFQLHWNYG